MPRKPKPDTFEKEGRMLKAIAAIKSKEFPSAEAAAKHFNVPASTLRHRVKGRVSRREGRAGLQKLTPSQEEELVRWITQLTITGYSPQYSLVREMAEAIRSRPASSINASTIVDPADRKTGPLGKEWVTNFLHRHPELKSVVGAPIDANRVKDTTVEALERWFEAYKREVLDDENVLMSNVYNFDESGFSIGTIQAARVIVSLKADSRFQANPGRQEWVTVMEAICTDGSAISPVVIFKGEQFNTSWVSNVPVPEGWLFSNNSKGWTNNERGSQWLETCFDPQTREKANGKPRVLICDGHGSHITGKFIRYCMDNNIKLLILPPHSSHLTQPLDISVFGPLKKYLSNQVYRIVGANLAKLTKTEWLRCYIPAREDAFSFHNIESGWSGAGLVPFQPRKVIRRKLGRSPTPPSTPPPDGTIFDTALLNSSQSNIEAMQKANRVLKDMFTSNSDLATPQQNYILRLGQKAEQYKARIAILDKQKEAAESVLNKRKRVESGTRLFLKGQHLVSQEEIVRKIEAHEMMVGSRRKKKVKKTTKKVTDTVEFEESEEEEAEMFEAIVVEPYRK